MRLWRNIRRVLWAVGITFVLLLATAECLYRAALTRLPLLPPHMNGASVPVLLARATWAAEEGSAALQIRRLMPWTILRVLTAALRARKRSASTEGFVLASHAARQWLHLVEDRVPRQHRGLDRLTLSIWISRNWSAEELIAFYTEQVWLGRGVETAALEAPLRLAPGHWLPCGAGRASPDRSQVQETPRSDRPITGEFSRLSTHRKELRGENRV